MSTQFQAGGPSGNPKGRPRKRSSANLSLEQKLQEDMWEKIPVWRDAKMKMIPRIHAMLAGLWNDYPTAPTHRKIAILKLMIEVAPDAAQNRPQESSGEALQKLAEWLLSKGDENKE